MNERSKQALEFQNFFKRLEKLLQETEKSYQKIDNQLIRLEAEYSVQQKKVFTLQKKQEELKKLLQELFSEKTGIEDQRGQLELQKNALLDFKSMIKGTLFGAARARFFTHSLQDFALQHGSGEMIIEAFIEASLDGFRISFQGKIFWFLKNQEGMVFFHPNPIPDNLEKIWTPS